MKKILSFLIENNSLIYLFFTIINFLYYVFKGSMTTIESFLLSFLTWSVGIRGLVACIANYLPRVSEAIAKQYNWPKGTTFQREIASAEGAFGTLGVLCNFFGGYFWAATIIGVSFCWFFSEFGGLVRIYKKRKDPNYKWNSCLHLGMLLDFLFAIALFSCFLVWMRAHLKQ